MKLSEFTVPGIGVISLWCCILAITPAAAKEVEVIQPKVVTAPVPNISDDPAIWINREDPLASLVIGTDRDRDGGLYAFNLDGKIVASVKNLRWVDNVEIHKGFMLGGKPVDIAVLAERETMSLRVFRMPDLVPLDAGDLAVFSGEKEMDRQATGLAIYQRPSDKAVFVIVTRKTGPKDGYLWQYRLADNGQGKLTISLVRKFGAFSGGAEIEAVAVDHGTGSVYYSDESYGIREYAADPDAADAGKELSVFGTAGFSDDREGISIYPIRDGTGYILVSDQGSDSFQVFRRERKGGGLSSHIFVKSVRVAARKSDGSEVTNVPLGSRFPAGMLVAMSADRTFHFYSWTDLAGDDLMLAPNGDPQPVK